jgi:hypothetical protein
MRRTTGASFIDMGLCHYHALPTTPVAISASTNCALVIRGIKDRIARLGMIECELVNANATRPARALWPET